MRRMFQFAQKLIEWNFVGMCHVLKRAKACKVTADAGGFPCSENCRDVRASLKSLGYCEVS
jgi:hypothetical protein